MRGSSRHRETLRIGAIRGHRAARTRARGRLSGRDALTAAELRVARMAAEGNPNSEIAQALFITTRTVKAHLTHIYEKLGVNNRVQLAALSRERI